MDHRTLSERDLVRGLMQAFQNDPEGKIVGSTATKVRPDSAWGAEWFFVTFEDGTSFKVRVTKEGF